MTQTPLARNIKPLRLNDRLEGTYNTNITNIFKSIVDQTKQTSPRYKSQLR